MATSRPHTPLCTETPITAALTGVSAACYGGARVKLRGCIPPPSDVEAESRSPWSPCARREACAPPTALPVSCKQDASGRSRIRFQCLSGAAARWRTGVKRTGIIVLALSVLVGMSGCQDQQLVGLDAEWESAAVRLARASPPLLTRPVSDAQRQGFAGCSTVHLVLTEDYDTKGLEFPVWVRERVTGVLRDLNLRVVADEAADATLTLVVSAEPLSARYSATPGPPMPGERGIEAWTGGRARAEAILSLKGLPEVRAVSHEQRNPPGTIPTTLGFVSVPVGRSIAWDFAEECSGKAVWSLALALDPHRFCSCLRASGPEAADALALLMEWGDGAGVRVVLLVLKDQEVDADLRCAAAGALATIRHLYPSEGTQDIVDALVHATLEDSNVKVRSRASRTLTYLEDLR